MPPDVVAGQEGLDVAEARAPLVGEGNLGWLVAEEVGVAGVLGGDDVVLLDVGPELVRGDVEVL